ncbi:hypothetical protein Dimus_034031 [Dionaea muscipula]
MSAFAMSSATIAATKASPAQATAVAPSIGFRSRSTIPGMKKNVDFLSSIPGNGSRIKMMLVWPPEGKLKFETLSYLPPLSQEELTKEVDYLLGKKWIPCLEFTVGQGHISRDNNRSPGYYDGRYWTMWKLPMFGTTDASQVLAELEEAKKTYPQAFIRIIGFDNKRQVGLISARGCCEG